jgi:hypothetical protein
MKWRRSLPGAGVGFAGQRGLLERTTNGGRRRLRAGTGGETAERREVKKRWECRHAIEARWRVSDSRANFTRT